MVHELEPQQMTFDIVTSDPPIMGDSNPCPWCGVMVTSQAYTEVFFPQYSRTDLTFSFDFHVGCQREYKRSKTIRRWVNRYYNR